jgi:hypothetical protein
MSAMFYIGPAIGIIVTVMSLIFVFRLFGGLQKAAKEEQRILTTGQPAGGQIINVQQTGTYINNQPQVVISLQVFPPNGQPYQTSLTKVVSMFQIPQFQVGAQVALRIDPANPMQVAIAGAQPMMGQPMMGQPPMAQPGPYGQPPQMGQQQPYGQPPAQGQAPYGQPPMQQPGQPQWPPRNG